MINETIRTQILDGCLRDYPKYLAGNYRGYYITIESAPGEYIIKVNASTPGDPNNQQLNVFLNQYSALDNPVSKIQTYMYMCVIWIPEPQLEAEIPEILNRTICPILDYLSQHNYISGCDKCGNASETLNCCEIDGGYHFQCRNCTNALPNYTQTVKIDTKPAKSNFIAGLVGALLGSLIGCAAWVLIYKLGYIAGIAGAITAICAMKGYELLGGRLDKKGVVGSVVIMLIMIYVSNKVAWTWDAYDSLKDYGWSFAEIFQELNYIIEESDLMGGYITDLVIGYILTIVASFKSIAAAFRAS
ncbi:MAG: hypothetical protein HFG41_08475 [Coprococcus sp.]|nr:hypothetical protein [Coprococcus sp.]